LLLFFLISTLAVDVGMGIGAFRIWIQWHSPPSPTGCIWLAYYYYYFSFTFIPFPFSLPEPQEFPQVFTPFLTLISSWLISFFFITGTLPMVYYQISMFGRFAMLTYSTVHNGRLTIPSSYPSLAISISLSFLFPLLF